MAFMYRSDVTLYDYPLAFNPQKINLMIAEKQAFISSAPRPQPSTPLYENAFNTIKRIKVDLFSGQSLQPWFMQIQPQSTVPAMTIKSFSSGLKTFHQTSEILHWVDHIWCGGPNGKAYGPLGGDKVDRDSVNDWTARLHAWDGNIFAAVNLDESTTSILKPLSVFRIKTAQAHLKRAELAVDVELAQMYRNKLEEMASTASKKDDAQLVEVNRKELVSLLDEAEAALNKSHSEGSKGEAFFLCGKAYSSADVLLTTILFRIETVGQTGLYLKPRPMLSAYYTQVKARLSFQKAFGSAISKASAAMTIVPCILKAKWAALTGRY
jgi:glutathione S-transferase